MVGIRLIKIIKKRTEKIRYYSVLFIIKRITPSLYQRILPIINETNLLARVPRPSILFMKEYFNQRFVIGAKIGVNKGINSKSILKELNVKKLYLIDAWLNYKEIQADRPQKTNFEFVLNELKDDKRTEIIRELSKDAVKFVKNDSLDFVYIDANHLFEFVYQDINLWYPKVKENGIIAGHDVFGHIGVLKAVEKFCKENKYSFNIEIPDWYFIKNI